MRHNVQVELTLSGLRQFNRLNRELGLNAIKEFVLRYELSAYIASYKESGASLDTICQEVRFEDGIYLLMQRRQGIWYITDIWNEEAPQAFAPVFFWKRIKRGWKELLVQILISWQELTRPLEGGAVT